MAKSLTRDKLYRIGLITHAYAEPFHTEMMDTVQSRLNELGYCEGDNTEYCRAFGNRDSRLTEANAKALVAWQPHIILSFMTNADLAVKRATATSGTPILCWSMEPVDSGLVASMKHPGGNLTAFAFPPGLAWRQLRVLKAVKPSLSVVGCLHHPGYAPSPGALIKLQQTAPMLGLTISVYEALTVEAITTRIQAMKADGVTGMVCSPHRLFSENGALIGELTQRYGLPAIGLTDLVKAGGIASFVPDFPRIWSAAAVTADRIIKGANPGEIPVDRHINPRMTLSVRSAERLGLTVPDWLIDEADEVIT